MISSITIAFEVYMYISFLVCVFCLELSSVCSQITACRFDPSLFDVQRINQVELIYEMSGGLAGL